MYIRYLFIFVWFSVRLKNGNSDQGHLKGDQDHLKDDQGHLKDDQGRLREDQGHYHMKEVSQLKELLLLIRQGKGFLHTGQGHPVQYMLKGGLAHNKKKILTLILAV